MDSKSIIFLVNEFTKLRLHGNYQHCSHVPEKIDMFGSGEVVKKSTRCT